MSDWSHNAQPLSEHLLLLQLAALKGRYRFGPVEFETRIATLVDHRSLLTQRLLAAVHQLPEVRLQVLQEAAEFETEIADFLQFTRDAGQPLRIALMGSAGTLVDRIRKLKIEIGIRPDPNVASDRPMECEVDLDWATYTCPCGQSIRTTGCTDEGLARWLTMHKQHTTGKIREVVTDRGATVLERKPEPVLKDFPEHRRAGS